jgi:hypothetical protein
MYTNLVFQASENSASNQEPLFGLSQKRSACILQNPTSLEDGKLKNPMITGTILRFGETPSFLGFLQFPGRKVGKPG